MVAPPLLSHDPRVRGVRFSDVRAATTVAAGQFAGGAGAAALTGLALARVNVTGGAVGFLCSGEVEGTAADVEPKACFGG